MANAPIGFNTQIMASFFLKETTYNAGVSMIDANACTLLGLTSEHATWPDTIENDKEQFSNKEHGFNQELIETRLEMPIVIPKATPNDIIGISALVLGSSTPAQDGALDAWSHKNVPVTVGTDLPSIQVEEKRGGVQQYAYTGIKGNTMKISGEQGGLISVEAGLVGSGSRAESATAFAASITESWLKVNLMKAWIETGADISITATLVQDAEDISSTTSDDIKPVLQSFEVNWNNNLASQPGFGGVGVLQRLDYARRACDLSLTMLFLNKTHLDNYLSQEIYAFELDLKGALIAATGAMYYGVQIIVTRCKINAAPTPTAGPNDLLTATLTFEVFEDGTNAPLIVEGYNAQTAYMA